MKLCVRKTDNTVWRPSYPEGYNDGKALADAMAARIEFYFRRVERRRAGWWIFKRWQWVDTGEIWEPESGEFDVVDSKTLEA